MAARPWQLDWKRPRWQQSEPNYAASVEGTIVDHTAAAVLREEALREPVAEPTEETLVLTATLIQSSSNDDDFNNATTADILLLEILLPTDPPRRQQSKVFRWPMLVEENQESIFFPWFRPRRKKTRAVGMVAAALCRLPREDPQAAKEDVLDILQLLALGGGTRIGSEQDGDQHAGTSSVKSTESVPGHAADETTELILACLTSHGKVYFYSPWALLYPVDNDGTQHDQVQESMASFLLGNEILSALQSSILPLSQPRVSLSLSLPFLENTRSAVTEQQRPSHPVGEMNFEQKSGSMKRSVWDPALWDPLLDKASLSFQTKSNVPTHCMTAHEYLCVAGRGKRRRRYRSVDDHDYHHAAMPADDNASRGSVDTGTSEQFLPCDGGFVTFISLRTFAQVRTVYIPFVPTELSAFKWHDMDLIMVLGESDAVLIRTDVGSRQDTVQRFQIVPILLPDQKANMTAGGAAIAFLYKNSDSGLTLIQRTLDSIGLGESEKYDRYAYSSGQGRLPVVSIIESAAHVAHLPQGDPWCYLGAGWCMVGSSGAIHFVCFEGSSSANGAFTQHLVDEIHGRGVMCEIMSLDPFSSDTPENLQLPLTEPFGNRTSGQMIGLHDGPLGECEDEALNGIVLEALRDISSSSFKDETVSLTPPRAGHRQASSFSPREKFRRLLRHCASWKQLEESQSTREKLERQIPFVSVRLRSEPTGQYSLSLRGIAVNRHATSPFQSVLSWLSCNEDYFTAASLALGLLGDSQSLQHLWRVYDSVGDEEGLLDGIRPLYEEGDVNSAADHILTELADMTAGCLIKGGFGMSSTLSHFLKRNNNYDPSRICLMLAAVTSASMSTIEESRSSGEASVQSNLDKVLWPVRSLLEVGTSRDCLMSAVLLLNATVPDELRCRKRGDVAIASPPSIMLCKTVVALVVSSSEQATPLLLNLVDESSKKPFWESLDHETRLELFLLKVDGTSPMLRQDEVRTWALSALLKCIESEGGESETAHEMFPDEWLRGTTRACMKNAGCHLTNSLLEDGTEGSIPGESPVTPVAGLREFENRIRILRNALLPSPGSGGLDFDLLIPSLLILRKRGVQWDQSSLFTTENILNVACYMAGRRNVEAPLFPLDASVLMRECYLVGNVQAGANLVGGKNGLVLECAHVLIQDTGMQMEEAELFLLATELPDEGSESLLDIVQPFAINESHKVLLWLLKEHVLSVRKYGDFDSKHARGKVDPVVATRIILRTWWRLTWYHLKDATAWLVDWLDTELSLSDSLNEEAKVVGPSCSPQRLACAALSRGLMWAGEEDTSSMDTLAGRLQLPTQFLVRLSLACCGLVEALPTYVIKDSWKQMESSRATLVAEHHSAVPTRTTSMESLPSARSSDKLNESFQSAVSSLQ